MSRSAHNPTQPRPREFSKIRALPVAAGGGVIPKFTPQFLPESLGIYRVESRSVREQSGVMSRPWSPAARRHATSRFLAAVLLTLVASALPAQTTSPNPQSPARSTGVPASSAQPPAAEPPIENLLQLTTNLLSGGQPKNDAAFSKLAELGVRTVISVDGIKPDLAAAKKHGLRYIHIPIGYDGVDAHAQASLTRAVREVQGPIFIHCHHGKHRGPAAAAVACMAAGQMSREQAAAFMKKAGTGAEYAGLWRDVAGFKPLAANAELPELLAVAEVDSFAAAMAQLDRAWYDTGLCQSAGWQTPQDHADLAPVHQALLVLEGFKESRRNLEYDDAQLAAWLDEATVQAEQLHQSLKVGRREDATRAYKGLEAACLRCHEQYRN